jgi:curli biogenesis system outer membrane secretion channel CsgG
MLAQLLIAGLFLQAASNPPVAKPSTAAPSAVRDDDSDATALLKVKRIYVESFGDDVISKELQSMIVSSLARTKRFTVTENRDRADAILKGVALENTSQELHAYREGTVAGRGAISDASTHTETVNDARLSVRLVNPNGDVIWTSTQESKGAKYQGSSADATDKCVKQLLRDVEKLEGTITPRAIAEPPAKSTQHN